MAAGNKTTPEQVAGQLDRLAEALVLASPDDDASLVEIGEGLKQVSKQLRKKRTRKSKSVTRIVKRLEEARTKDEAERQAALDEAGLAVTALREFLVDGRPEQEVVFPGEHDADAPADSAVVAAPTVPDEPEPMPVEAAVSEEQRPAAPQPPAAPKPRRFALPAHIDERIFGDFLERQPGVLEDLESLTLELEKAPDTEKYNTLRRLIHTLKGESGMLGLDGIQRLCHRLEDRLAPESVAQMVDLLLGAKDWLGRMFAFYAGRGDEPEPVEAMIAKVEAFRPQAVCAPASAAPAPPQPAVPAPPLAAAPLASSPAPTTAAEVQPTGAVRPAAASAPPASDAAPVEAAPAEPEVVPVEGDPELLKEFISEAREHLDASDNHLLSLESDPRNDEALNAVFRAFHTIKGVAGFLELHDIQKLSHEAENVLDRARKNTLVLEGAAMDVTFEAADMLKKMVQQVADALAAGSGMKREKGMPALIERIKAVQEGRAVAAPPPVAAPGQKLGEILVAQGAISPDKVDEALKKQSAAAADGEGPLLGTILVEEGAASVKDVAHALRAQKAAAASPANAPTGQTGVTVKETIKVDADRLDRLVDMIGELVIAEAMVSQSRDIRQLNTTELNRHLAQLDKITRELQEIGTSLRMVPIRSTFQKMARLARDLSKKFNKPVEFVMAGEDTELDKSVVEKIGDPLVHMVRNALDHGLEATAEERRKAGKPETGRVELRAFHRGGNIWIELEDDGRGLDRDVLLAKGREKGLVREGENLSDEEIYKLIFAPGFSTAKQVTDVSGRGVGMDVVRRNIEALRGQVEIRSTKGRGTVFSIRLPLTLAIIDGMVVRVGRERYIIPTLSVVMSIRPEKKDISTVLNKGEMLQLQGKLLPFFRMGELFQVEGASRDATQALVVIVEDNGRRAGILCDELLGQQQIVIKSLGEALRGIDGLAGGAIMPDGTVGLILDVAGLVRLAHSGAKNGIPEEPSAGERRPAPEPKTETGTTADTMADARAGLRSELAAQTA